VKHLFATIGLAVAIGGAAALTPFFATVGAGMTLAAITAALSVLRWMRSRNRRAPVEPDASGRG